MTYDGEDRFEIILALALTWISQYSAYLGEHV